MLLRNHKEEKTHLQFWKKFVYKWTCIVQTCVVQESSVVMSFSTDKWCSFVWKKKGGWNEGAEKEFISILCVEKTRLKRDARWYEPMLVELSPGTLGTVLSASQAVWFNLHENQMNPGLSLSPLYRQGTGYLEKLGNLLIPNITSNSWEVMDWTHIPLIVLLGGVSGATQWTRKEITKAWTGEHA